MSTYNGEAYLADQLDSILLQRMPEGFELNIHVRDDGSSDNTELILRSYAESGLLTYEMAENRGSTRSFMDLLSSIDEQTDYVAFADQDDIWRQDKLWRALTKLETGTKPLRLYWSKVMFSDEFANPIKPSNPDPIGINFAISMYGATVPGMAMIFTSELARKAADGDNNNVYMHDWWMQMLAYALGEVYHDDEATVYYRRLPTSVSPSNFDAIALLKRRIKMFFKNDDFSKVTNQLAEFRRRYGDELSHEDKADLDRAINGGRLSKVFFPKRLRGMLQDEIIVRACFLLGFL